MKISVFYHHIAEAAKQRKLPAEEILKQVHELGIDYAELDMADVLDTDEAYRKLCRAGIGISSIYGFYDFGNTPDGRAGFRQIDRAAELNCKKIMMIPGFYSSMEEAVRKMERDNMLKAMREMCEYAASRGIQPTIEDFDDTASPIATAGQMEWFTRRIPQLKVTFDTGNFLCSGEDEWEAYELLRQDIVHVHCKDRSLTARPGCEEKRASDGTLLYPAPAGAGCIRMKEIITALEEAGYDGIYTIEHFGAEDQLQFIKASAKWLKGCAGT